MSLIEKKQESPNEIEKFVTEHLLNVERELNSLSSANGKNLIRQLYNLILFSNNKYYIRNTAYELKQFFKNRFSTIEETIDKIHFAKSKLVAARKEFDVDIDSTAFLFHCAGKLQNLQPSLPYSMFLLCPICLEEKHTMKFVYFMLTCIHYTCEECDLIFKCKLCPICRKKITLKCIPSAFRV